MSRRGPRTWLALCAILLLGSGCRSTQVAHDGITFRQALQTMYTDQAMDNLIRARKNEGFVQLKYSDLLVQVTDQHFGELTNAQTLINGNQLNVAAPVTSSLGMITHSFQNVFTIHGSAQRLGQMSFHADPVTDNNEVYDAYLSFAKNPALLMESDRKPDKCDYHIMREECGKYYYVPLAAGPAFQQLMMKTTFMRGPETIPAGFYQVRVMTIKEDRSTEHAAIVQLDKAIPRDTGRMVIGSSTGGRVQLKVGPSSKDGKIEGQLTTDFDVRWLPSDPINADGLVGANVRIYLNKFPPELNPSASPDATQIRQNVDRIRSSLSPFLRPPGS